MFPSPFPANGCIPARAILYRAIAVITLTFGVAGCLPPRDHAALPEVSDRMTTWATGQWADATTTQLMHGRDTMLGKCTACHSMPSPDHESAKEWPSVMKSMSHKAKLPDTDEAAMLRYILAARETAAP